MPSNDGRIPHSYELLPPGVLGVRTHTSTIGPFRSGGRGGTDERLARPCALRHLARHGVGEVDRDRLSAVPVKAVQQTMQPAHVSLSLAEAAGGREGSHSRRISGSY